MADIFVAKKRPWGELKEKVTEYKEVLNESDKKKEAPLTNLDLPEKKNEEK